MKITAIAAGLALALGMYSGIKIAGMRHDAAMARANEEMRAVQDAHNAQLNALSKEYYEQFETITNREPTVVERRVYVKANCVPPATAAGMGDAPDADEAGVDGAATGSTGKVELAQETVQAVAGVADKAELLYQQCVTRLQYFQKRHGQ